MQHHFKGIIMFKYLVVFGSFLSFCSTMRAQNKTLYYKVHPLKIAETHTQFAGNDVDFGYNFTESLDQEFIHNGYYLWIQDQWYLIKNAKTVFKGNNATPLLFEITDTAQKLKIEDASGVVYTYPIEAIETYTISEKDFLNWKAQPQSLIYTTEIIGKTPDVLVQNESPKTDVLPQEIKTENEPDNKISMQQEEEKSPVLDVLDIVETKIETIVPYSVEEPKAPQDGSQESTVKSKEEEQSLPETTSKPANAYERAVAEGFDGTVTEWIDWVDNQGGKTAYQQAVEAGFEGDEAEWKRSLWGTTVDPEIEQQEKTTSIVMKWMKELNSEDGYSPYEMALRNGFYGTFTEWVESVIGKDGEKQYLADVEKGYTKTYKEWIEEKLNVSNEEILRKEKLRKNNFVVVPNVRIEVPELNDEVATFDLYQYYQEYYGSSVVSSTGNSSKIELRRTDLEYQITWFNKNDINIVELTPDGVLKYTCGTSGAKNSTLNVRFVLKN